MFKTAKLLDAFFFEHNPLLFFFKNIYQNHHAKINLLFTDTLNENILFVEFVSITLVGTNRIVKRLLTISKNGNIIPKKRFV